MYSRATKVDGLGAPVHIGEVIFVCFIAYFIDSGRSRTPKPFVYCRIHRFWTCKGAKSFHLLHESSILDVQGRQNLIFIARFNDLRRSRTQKPSFLCKKVGFLKMAISKVLQNMHDSLNFHVFASINITLNQN